MVTLGISYNLINLIYDFGCELSVSLHAEVA